MTQTDEVVKIRLKEIEDNLKRLGKIKLKNLTPMQDLEFKCCVAVVQTLKWFLE